MVHGNVGPTLIAQGPNDDKAHRGHHHYSHRRLVSMAEGLKE